jgi:hypothetical protein
MKKLDIFATIHNKRYSEFVQQNLEIKPYEAIFIELPIEIFQTGKLFSDPYYEHAKILYDFSNEKMEIYFIDNYKDCKRHMDVALDPETANKKIQVLAQGIMYDFNGTSIFGRSKIETLVEDITKNTIKAIQINREREAKMAEIIDKNMKEKNHKDACIVLGDAHIDSLNYLLSKKYEIEGLSPKFLEDDKERMYREQAEHEVQLSRIFTYQLTRKLIPSDIIEKFTELRKSSLITEENFIKGVLPMEEYLESLVKILGL